MPSALFCFLSNLSHGSPLLWTSIVPAMVECVIHDHTRHVDLMRGIMFPEIFHGIVQQWYQPQLK